MALISEVAQICSFICSEMSLCQSLSYILAVLNLRFFSLTPTLCCQIQNGLTAKRIEIQTPATSQMKDILTLFLNINKLSPLEKRNIRMNTRETNSTFFFRYCYMSFDICIECSFEWAHAHFSNINRLGAVSQKRQDYQAHVAVYFVSGAFCRFCPQNP